MLHKAVSSLDPRSRRVISEFALQFCVGLVLVALPCILGSRPWSGAAKLLALMFSLNGLVHFIRAICRGDRLGGPSLNLWDSAIAFNGCAWLLHAIMDYPA
jgi:hypothetical protein